MRTVVVFVRLEFAGTERLALAKHVMTGIRQMGMVVTHNVKSNKTNVLPTIPAAWLPRDARKANVRIVLS